MNTLLANCAICICTLLKYITWTQSPLVTNHSKYSKVDACIFCKAALTQYCEKHNTIEYSMASEHL